MQQNLLLLNTHLCKRAMLFLGQAFLPPGLVRPESDLPGGRIQAMSANVA
jgi:hypothetical protein